MATCKECVHSGICAIQLEPNYVLDRAQKLMRESNNVEHECLSFKDRSRFVELPCKVGDTVFVMMESSDILKYKVFYINIFCGEVYDEIEIVLNRNYHRIGYKKERFEYELGKTLFFTKEEAEQTLAKQNQPDNTP